MRSAVTSAVTASASTSGRDAMAASRRANFGCGGAAAVEAAVIGCEDYRKMVNAALSGCAGALRKHRQAFVADLGVTTSDRNPLRLCALVAIDRDLAVLEGGHVGCVTRHDAALPLGPRHDDHVDIVRHHQPVRRDELEMQIGH